MTKLPVTCECKCHDTKVDSWEYRFDVKFGILGHDYNSGPATKRLVEAKKFFRDELVKMRKQVEALKGRNVQWDYAFDEVLEILK